MKTICEDKNDIKENYSKKIIKRNKVPTILWLVLTYRCNSKCSHCYAQAANNDLYMQEETIDNVFRILSYNIVKKVILIGGEPSLYPNLDKLINRIRHYSNSISIVTNGKLYDSRDFLVSLKNAGLESTDISVGNEIAYYNTPTMIDNQIIAVKNAIDVFGNDKVSAIVTIGKEKISNIIYIIRRLEKIGLKRIAVNVVIPAVHNSERIDDISCSLKELAFKYEEMYNYISNSTELTPVFYMNMPLCLFKKEFLKKIFSRGHAISGCHVITGEGLVIDPLGNLLPCTHWVDVSSFNMNKSFSLINTKKNFEKFWSDESPGKIARDLCRYRNEKCMDCNLFGVFCFCGCPLTWLAYNPTKDIKGFLP